MRVPSSAFHGPMLPLAVTRPVGIGFVSRASNGIVPPKPDVPHVQLVNREHERRSFRVARHERQLGVVGDEVIDDDTGRIDRHRASTGNRVSPREGRRS